ncbi:MAG: biotin/lipoyl-containing protein [Planctomycetota bacterium]
MNDPLELRLQRDGETLQLLAPSVGWFTSSLAKGQAVTPGAPVGVLRQLDRSFPLVAPEGALGRVVSERPERVHEPVEFGRVLYELAPLEVGAEDEAQAAAEAAAGPVLRAPFSGRFWTRPGPGEPNFVAVGDVVESGQPIGLIEVMKTFTQVPYLAKGGLPERACIVRIVADDGAELREGEALLEVEPA